MVKNPLKKCHIAVSGNFGPGRSREVIKNWITINGGTYAQSMSADITHLVCSEEDYKNGARLVKAARIRDDIKIVSFDWFEDSMHKRRHLSEKKYEWGTILNQKTKAKAARKKKENVTLQKDAQKFADGCEAARADINSGESELYPDITNKSMGRLLLDSFVDDMGEKKTKAKEKKAKTRKEQATAKKTEISKPPKKTAAKAPDRKAKAPAPASIYQPTVITDSDSDDGVRQNTIDRLHNEFREVEHDSPEPKKKRRRAKLSHFDSDGNPFFSGSRPVIPDGDSDNGVRQNAIDLLNEFEEVEHDSLEPKKKRRRVNKLSHFDEAGNPIFFGSGPVIDESKIIPLPSGEEIQTTLLQLANLDWRFPDNYHVYRDISTGLDHAIMLLRVDSRLNRGAERVFLRLYESNAEPHMYATFVRHDAYGDVSNQTVVPLGSGFGVAFSAFCNVFMDYTHIPWQLKEMAVGNAGAPRMVEEVYHRTNGGVVSEIPFQYIQLQPMI